MKLYFCRTLRMQTILVGLMITFSLPGRAQSQQKASYLPNLKLTPGDTLKVNKEDLCGSKYENFDGSIPISLKRKVFDLYGIRGDKLIPYNVDHLIPVGLGGSNSLKNLWPQPVSGEWSYHKKNKLEQRLHKLVCSGELDPERAQQEISTDWVSAYEKYLGAPARQKSARD